MKPFRALLLSSALLPLVAAIPAQAVNWVNQGYTHGIDGFNSLETTISASNVQNLALAWQSSTTDINGVFAMVEDNGTIFVLTEDSGADENGYVVALNASTGAELWKAPTGYNLSEGFSGLAAGSGRVFAPCGNYPSTTEEGLCAYSQTTGKPLWFDNFVVQGTSGLSNVARPTFASGVVYLSESMCDPHVPTCDSFWAINARTGGIIWGAQAPASGFDYAGANWSPAVSTSVGLMYAPCQYVFGGNEDKLFTGLCTFETSNGTGSWQSGEVNTTNGQDGPGGVSVSGTTAFFQQAYADLDENVMTAFDANTGNPKWNFNSVFAYHDAVQPTVAKSVVYWPDGNGELWALKEKTGATLWSFNNWPNGCSPVGGANGTKSQPQVANGVVFITTSCFNVGFHSATTFALSASNGTILWSGGGGTAFASGAAPMIVNGTLYSDCVQVCAYNLAEGHARKPRTQ